MATTPSPVVLINKLIACPCSVISAPTPNKMRLLLSLSAWRHLLLSLEQLPLRAAATSTNLSQSTVANNMVDSNKSDVIELTEICDNKFHSSTDDQILRKRSSKRDRHSKINTAQGPRDRRMRLSLKVAREFFDLQDKLSFDKASKTVEWLLVQAKSEIKKLSSGSPHMCYSGSAGTKNASSTSECEMLSEMNAETTTKGRNASIKGCWDTPLETGDQHSGIQNFNPSLEVQLAAEVDAAIYHEQEKLGTAEVLIDEELVIMSKYWSPLFPQSSLQHWNSSGGNLR
ncbi:hypothetical protein OIU84_001783 [Salix udensis]|uniref:TCP domain-containing protein n=1 Tax=Salix udensis TaxID=889485 RepID=A0AAD6K9S2_9ROSI|nr:hypothetical protein OIU84_001783 [Salix udensis]